MVEPIVQEKDQIAIVPSKILNPGSRIAHLPAGIRDLLVCKYRRAVYSAIV